MTRIEILVAEMANDPESIGYATLLTNWDHDEAPENRSSNTAIAQSIISAMTEATTTRTKERYINERTLVAELGPTVAETIMEKLEGAADLQGGLLVRVCRWMQVIEGEWPGLDIGTTAAQGMIDQLVSGGVLTSDEGEALQELGKETVTRDVVIGCANPTVIEIRRAVRLMEVV